jgi:hypothetical protein
MFAEQHAATTLNEALFAYSVQEMAKIGSTDRFVHYTSAEAATKIIGGDANGKRSLWLRNSQLMNDFTEVDWGRSCLEKALGNWRLRERLQRALTSIHPELYQRFENTLPNEWGKLGEEAYLLSLAIHNAQECLTGKLSMWRAYGGERNVCLVFNTSPFLTYQSAYELVLSPVMYGAPSEFAREFEGLVHRLEQRVSLLRHLSPEYVCLNLKRALCFAVLSTKHAGFHEETEWRVIHRHSENRPDPPFIVDPQNTAKRVYQIPLENRPEANLWGI